MRSRPKTRGKLSQEARALLGQDRTCEACGDTTTISARTYTPTKKGWKAICKVCEALGVEPSPVENLPTTGVTEDEDAVATMYHEARKPRPDNDALNAAYNYLHKELKERPDRESFRLFLLMMQPLIANWSEPGAIHEDIIKGLLSTHKRRLIIATRHSAKSTLTAVYCAWRIYRDPEIKILVVSRGENLAARMLYNVRNFFIGLCPLLAHLVPTEECKDNITQFVVPQALEAATGGYTFTSLGITSNIVGHRADLIVADDVEGRQDDTPDKVSALYEILSEIHMINPNGEKLLLGTYQSEYSLYARLADEESKDETGEMAEVWELHRACMFEEDIIDGEKVYHSRWPSKFSDQDAADWRRSVPERKWRLHMMLVADVTLLNEKPLKIGQFLVVNHDPKSLEFPLKVEPGPDVYEGLPTWEAPKGDVWRKPRLISEQKAQYVQTIASIDPASGLAGRDAIGVAILGITGGGLAVIRHLEGVRGPDPRQNIRRTAEIVAQFKSTNVVVEEGVQSMWGKTLQTELMLLNWPMLVEQVTTGGVKKGQRIIEALQPVMAAGRMAILTDVIRSDHGGQFVEQLVSVSYDGRSASRRQHDDIVDALAHAVRVAKHSLVGELSDAIAEQQVARLDRWRGSSLRRGGLGISDASRPAAGRQAGEIGGNADTRGKSMGERLLEEDEVLVSLEARYEGLLETLRTDAAMGRPLDLTIQTRAERLKGEIVKLREVSVL